MFILCTLLTLCACVFFPPCMNEFYLLYISLALARALSLSLSHALSLVLSLALSLPISLALSPPPFALSLFRSPSLPHFLSQSPALSHSLPSVNYGSFQPGAGAGGSVTDGFRSSASTCPRTNMSPISRPTSTNHNKVCFQLLPRSAVWLSGAWVLTSSCFSLCSMLSPATANLHSSAVKVSCSI